jgi:hypothetical protein
MQVETPRQDSKKTKNPEPRADVPMTVDELLQLDPERLATLYADASVPQIGKIDGDLKGRMLAWPAISGRAAALIRMLAGSDRFPWRGKSFRPTTAEGGEGLIRAIKDEIRELRPGLYLGQAYLHLKSDDHLVLYFGLQSR